MKILHLSWEYPPLVYGGLGRHVHALAEAQAAAGHDVTVVTQTEGEPGTELVNGVRVVRSRRDPPTVPLDNEHLLAWVAGLEHALSRAVVSLRESWQPDVIHAHDWVVAHVAAAAVSALDKSLVTTLHATEAGRHQGWVPEGLPRSIFATEWWLANLSTRTIACSEHMKWETNQLFGTGPQTTDVIPNGIDTAEWQADPAIRGKARQTFGAEGPLLVYTGRLEWEKGVHTLLDAMPRIVKAYPDVTLVVAGKGGMSAELKERAKKLKIQPCVRFAGWLPEADLQALVADADVAIAPSLYEPFGLIALEALALGTPVVVSDIGGLGGIAEEGKVATTFRKEKPDSLAKAVTTALENPDVTARQVQTARTRFATRYHWPLIASRTTDTYAQAIAEQARGPRSGRIVEPLKSGAAPDPGSDNLLY